MKPSDLPQATQRALGLTPKKRKVKKAMTGAQILSVIQWQHAMKHQNSNAARCVFREHRVDTGANLRGKQWWRIKKERAIGCTLGKILRPVLPCIITLTRYSMGQLDAHDGLPNAFKAVVDGIADAMGIRDNNPGVQWKYEQAKAPARCFGFVVSWRPMEEHP